MRPDSHRCVCDTGPRCGHTERPRPSAALRFAVSGALGRDDSTRSHQGFATIAEQPGWLLGLPAVVLMWAGVLPAHMYRFKDESLALDMSLCIGTLVTDVIVHWQSQGI